MYTIRNATEAFAQLDGTSEPKVTALDKALRNISQRFYLPPKDRDGRADLFSLDTICALRLLQKAVAFGLVRWQIEEFARFLQNAPLGSARREGVPGGSRGLSKTEEALQRIGEGESFDFSIVMLADGKIEFRSNWEPEIEHENPIVGTLKEAGRGSQTKIDAQFSLPASRLIAELIAVLN